MKQHTIYKSKEGKLQILDSYEAYLQLYETGFERIYADTRFGKTHTLVAGPLYGKPIIILQGGNCINPMTLSWFSPLFHTFRIYAPDTIGHPGYSDETRVSAKDDSLAQWLSDIMEFFKIDHCAFIGPSYGAGIILRLAACMPEKITCSVLVCPSGIRLGSKMKMIQKILLPMMMFNLTSSQKQLQKITDIMSENSMKTMDKRIIGEIFTHVRLEQDMPKLTEKNELLNYSSPTMVMVGNRDIFFPAHKIVETAKKIIPNLVSTRAYEMGHFPSESHLNTINQDIRQFLAAYY